MVPFCSKPKCSLGDNRRQREIRTLLAYGEESVSQVSEVFFYLSRKDTMFVRTEKLEDISLFNLLLLLNLFNLVFLAKAVNMTR